MVISRRFQPFDRQLLPRKRRCGGHPHVFSLPVTELREELSQDTGNFLASLTSLPWASRTIHASCLQDDTLMGERSSVDVSTKENLLELVQIGKNLLNKKVSRVNLETGIFQEIDEEGTNADALTQLAKRLSRERQLRKATVAAK